MADQTRDDLVAAIASPEFEAVYRREPTLRARTKVLHDNLGKLLRGEQLPLIEPNVYEVDGGLLESGVYFFFDEHDHLLYVGQSRCLLARIADHRQHKRFQQVARIRWMPCPPFDLNQLEASMIRRLKPKWNKHENPRHQARSVWRRLRQRRVSEPAEPRTPPEITITWEK